MLNSGRWNGLCQKCALFSNNMTKTGVLGTQNQLNDYITCKIVAK